MLNTNFSPWPSFSQEEVDAVSSVLLSNRVNYWTGSKCREFENEFAKWCNVDYSVALANGTLALDSAFKALEISKGDEVIVTSRTFIASVSSIVNAGATPIFVDVDLDSQNIDPQLIKKNVTSKTKAIVCVHLAGWPCEMDEINQIASDNNLFVIEDCSQAHGAKYKGNPVGSIGDIGCWSFCQDKIISTGGEGGMVTTNNKNLWKKMWSYKDHGKDFDLAHKRAPSNVYRYIHDSFGTNWRMTEMQAVIGLLQLNKMDYWHKKRNENANQIWQTARKCRALRVPIFGKHVQHAAYKCYLFVENSLIKSTWDRERIINEIKDLGVPCYSGTGSEVYLEKSFENSQFRPKIRLPNAKKLGEDSLMFLVHPTLSSFEINKTCDAISNVMSRAAKENDK
ncbi:DegT/DnrJ/EryC1/StrS family aminotransferase [Pseudothioglobus sp. nBUS_23]|uniref:DegT/DnrJ/EryC1/StrS family aminotransferase n=1 Tax=Pseudothioglobus sp. nBUS_23 TaxID=3395318 RepID=UPI003EB6DF22